VAAALVSAEERRPEAARRERFAVGRVRGRDFGSDRPTAGPDLGRNGCRTAQATDQNQPQLALAFSRPTQHHAQKKCCKQPNGSEQMWRERAAAGYESKGMLDPARLVFIDETAVSTNMVRLRGRAPRGVRVIGAVPLGRWETITFVAALRHNKMVAPMVVEGAMTGEMFLAYVENCLVPTLRRNDIVVMDNCRVHLGTGIGRAIETVGATLRYLPKYSPDLNPIEMPYSKFKTFLRKVAARTIPSLNRAIRSFIPQLSPQECANYFRHAGYVSI
jgi:transposase